MAKSALDLWCEKLEHLRQEEAICSDPIQRFTLEKEIERVEAKIAAFDGRSADQSREQLVGELDKLNIIATAATKEVNWQNQEASSVAAYDAFICHASEDKDAVVRPLVSQLESRGLQVWLDESELRVGDSLRRSIDQGLARSRFGIVVLSPSFLHKEWPQRELDGLVSREVAGQKVILPVWHNIDIDGVRQFSPPLADRLATRTERGISSVADDLERAIRGQSRLTNSDNTDGSLADIRPGTADPDSEEIARPLRRQADALSDTLVRESRNLSKHATDMLKAVATDPNGQIFHPANTLGQGPVIHVGHRRLNDPTDPRSYASWKAALEELLHAGLLEKRGHEGNLFALTKAGYDVSDLLTE